MDWKVGDDLFRLFGHVFTHSHVFTNLDANQE